MLTPQVSLGDFSCKKTFFPVNSFIMLFHSSSNSFSVSGYGETEEFWRRGFVYQMSSGCYEGSLDYRSEIPDIVSYRLLKFDSHLASLVLFKILSSSHM